MKQIEFKKLFLMRKFRKIYLFISMLVTIIGLALLYQGIRTVVAERFLQTRGATTMAEIESLYAREAYSNIR